MQAEPKAEVPPEHGELITSIPAALQARPRLLRNMQIGLVLGRLMVQTLVSSSVHSHYPARVLQAFLSGAPVGQHYHATLLVSACHV